jgi:hypothetical protein
MGGIGKTALALATGHAAAANFPGGVLFFALGKHSAAPQSGAEARRRWLEASLLPGERQPELEADVDRLYCSVWPGHLAACWWWWTIPMARPTCGP